MGLEPESGFPDWIHEVRSWISSTSDRRLCLRRFLDLGFFITQGFGILGDTDALGFCGGK